MTTLLTDSSIETIAGGFAGFCQVLVGHPFDTLKVNAIVLLLQSIDYVF